MSGPLSGVKIVEIAGIGPGPFGAMMLADMGAEVVRVDRAQSVRPHDPSKPGWDLLNRGRKSIGVDLKSPEGVETVLRMVEQADGLIEGFRPGVAERLGIGPDECLARNERLVYGRVTGWGQDGPLAPTAGHDLNYIALTGALHAIGRAGGPPTPPLNLVGDFGGGALYLAFTEPTQQVHLEIVVSFAQRLAPLGSELAVLATRVVGGRRGDLGHLGGAGNVRGLGQRGEERALPVGDRTRVLGRAARALRLGHDVILREEEGESVRPTRTIAMFMICAITALRCQAQSAK